MNRTFSLTKITPMCKSLTKDENSWQLHLYDNNRLLELIFPLTLKRVMNLYRLIEARTTDNRYQEKKRKQKDKKNLSYAMIACLPCRRFTPPRPNILNDHVSSKSIWKIAVIALIEQCQSFRLLIAKCAHFFPEEI